jgi:hypothetical protein
MSIKSVITSLMILGTSSAALASPVHVDASWNAQIDTSWSSGPAVRDHRYDSTPTPTPYTQPDIRFNRRHRVPAAVTGFQISGDYNNGRYNDGRYNDGRYNDGRYLRRRPLQPAELGDAVVGEPSLG